MSSFCIYDSTVMKSDQRYTLVTITFMADNIIFISFDNKTTEDDDSSLGIVELFTGDTFDFLAINLFITFPSISQDLQ